MENNIINKGDIYYICEDPNKPSIGVEIWSNRPGIIVSNNVSNLNSGFVQVVYLSSSKNKRMDVPTHIVVTSDSKEVVALCEQIHTVDKSRLKTKLGQITDEELKDINEALLFSLGINDTKSPEGIFKKWEKYIKTYSLEKSFEDNDPSDDIEELKSKISILNEEKNGYKALADASSHKIERIKEIIN